MKISLITTVKNEAQHANVLIQSILNQTQKPDEWIVVDGGSEDNTVAAFKDIPLCTIIEIPCNRARGRNIAIEQASGEIIAITDVGCVPGLSWLEKLSDEVSLQNKQIAAGQTICRINGTFDAAQHALMDQFVSKSLKIRRPAASCRSLAFHRQAWLEYPFPEWLENCEDSYLLIKWRKNGWTTKFVGDADIEWLPPQSFFLFVEQYFRYIRGEGQAAIHTNRHLLRLSFYLGLGILPVLTGGNIFAVIFSSLVWIAYFLATSMRLADMMENRSLLFKIKSFLWMLPALPSMDAAKTAGFLVGSLERMILSKFRARR